MKAIYLGIDEVIDGFTLWHGKRYDISKISKNLLERMLHPD